jgi:hypothetical protein
MIWPASSDPPSRYAGEVAGLGTNGHESAPIHQLLARDQRFATDVTLAAASLTSAFLHPMPGFWGAEPRPSPFHGVALPWLTARLRYPLTWAFERTTGLEPATLTLARRQG